MKQSVPNSVDEYIVTQPAAARPKLEQMRAAIKRVAWRGHFERQTTRPSAHQALCLTKPVNAA